jgi:hypothetical protein
MPLLINQPNKSANKFLYIVNYKTKQSLIS